MSSGNTVQVRVYTPAGQFVGSFADPQVDMEPEHEYQITGQFLDSEGQPIERLEFNPEVLPYTIDISGCKKCTHGTLHRGYIQSGRQPIRMSARCKLD